MRLAKLRVWMAWMMIGASFCAISFGQEAKLDHLSPISPYDPIGYDQAVFNALIGKRASELWMICMPSFHPESAVILRSELENPKLEPPSGGSEKRRWVLEVAVASKPLSELSKSVKVERKRMDVDENVAKALQEAWAVVTRETRYGGTESGGVGGVTYQFCSGDQYGEVVAPGAGLPATLIELGDRLKKCVDAPVESRNPILEEAVGIAKEIRGRAAGADGKNAGEGAVRPK